MSPLDTLSTLTYLHFLDLHKNRLNGTISPLLNCTSLELLYVFRNDFCDEIPVEISLLPLLALKPPFPYFAATIQSKQQVSQNHTPKLLSSHSLDFPYRTPPLLFQPPPRNPPHQQSYLRPPSLRRRRSRPHHHCQRPNSLSHAILANSFGRWRKQKQGHHKKVKNYSANQ